MHVIVGAGPSGPTTAVQLAEAGEQVRIVTRSGVGPGPPAHRAGRRRRRRRGGAEPPQPRAPSRSTTAPTRRTTAGRPTGRRSPPSMLAAAESSGAPLVDHRQPVRLRPGRPPDDARTCRSPRHGQGPGAGDACGRTRWPPTGPAGSGVTEVRGVGLHRPAALDCWSSSLPALRAGRTVRLPGPLDVPHTFTYTGDVARALITLGRDERAWGRAWHVPSPPPVTMRELVRRAARVGGFAEPTVRSIPRPGDVRERLVQQVREGDARDELPVRPARSSSTRRRPRPCSACAPPISTRPWPRRSGNRWPREGPTPIVTAIAAGAGRRRRFGRSGGPERRNPHADRASYITHAASVVRWRPRRGSASLPPGRSFVDAGPPPASGRARPATPPPLPPDGRPSAGPARPRACRWGSTADRRAPPEFQRDSAGTAAPRRTCFSSTRR